MQHRYKFNVGGINFETTYSTIKNSFFLKKLVTSDFAEKIHSEFFIDRDPKGFKHILNALRDPTYIVPSKYTPELEFYGIQYHHLSSEKKDDPLHSLEKPISSFREPSSLFGLMLQDTCKIPVHYSQITRIDMTNDLFDVYRVADFVGDFNLYLNFDSSIVNERQLFKLIRDIRLIYKDNTLSKFSGLFLYIFYKMIPFLHSKGKNYIIIHLPFFPKEYFCLLQHFNGDFIIKPSFDQGIQHPIRPKLTYEEVYYGASDRVELSKQPVVSSYIPYVQEIHVSIPRGTQKHIWEISPISVSGLTELYYCALITINEIWTFIPIECIKLMINNCLVLDLPTPIVRHYMQRRNSNPVDDIYHWKLNNSGLSLQRDDLCVKLEVIFNKPIINDCEIYFFFLCSNYLDRKELVDIPRFIPYQDEK